MNKKEWIRLGIIVGVAILFGLVIVVGMHFVNRGENVIIESDNHEDLTTEIEFVNNSDMKEQDIRELVEEKRESLKNFFKNAQYYNISEIGIDFTIADDEKYIVVGETFLKTLQNLLSSDLYGYYWNLFTEVNPKYNIDLAERVYMAERDIFDNLYYNSAIAMIYVNEELLILENATNDKITAIENIKLCEEEDIDFCRRDDKFYFILEKEDNVWKISSFTEIKK